MMKMEKEESCGVCDVCGGGGEDGDVVMRELLYLLEERLAQHDNNRKSVQSELQRVYAEMIKAADLLEEKIAGEIRKDFEEKEEHTLNIIERLKKDDRDGDGGHDTNKLLEEAQEELSSEWTYAIQHLEEESFVDSYELKVKTKSKREETEEERGSERSDPDNEIEKTINKLQERLNRAHASMSAVREVVSRVCARRRREAEEMVERINKKLEPLFVREDARLQGVVNAVRERVCGVTPGELEELKTKVMHALVVNQRYSLGKSPHGEDARVCCDLIATKDAMLQYIGFGERKPSDVSVSFTDDGMLSLTFAFFREDEAEVLRSAGFLFCVDIKVWTKGEDEESTQRTLTKKFVPGEHIFVDDTFFPNTTYCLRTSIKHRDLCTLWSDEIELTTPEFKEYCVWKKCPVYVDERQEYSVDGENPRIATKNSTDYYNCTIIGSALVPPNAVTSWSIKLLESRNNDGNYICIGAAPSDVDQDGVDYNIRGWYFYCYDSTLISGPPHNYGGKEYGPRKEDGQYVHTGDSVGVVMDTAKGELSFVLNNVNYGVAYEGIPLDKPLVPCVILWCQGDSVELII